MNDKQLVAIHAAMQIQSDMVVGLGTGSTANYFIDALAQRCQAEGLKTKVVASSVASTIKAQSAGLDLIGFDSLRMLDVYVDGADEVTPDLTLLKGRGFDLVREKLLARAAKAFWVLIDPSKQVDYIGANYPVPIEVMPFAWQMVQQSLELIGGQANLRKTANQDGFVVSSYGSLVFDTVFAVRQEAQHLNHLLNNIPGVVEHGIFSELASKVFCAKDGQVHEI